MLEGGERARGNGVALFSARLVAEDDVLYVEVETRSGAPVVVQAELLRLEVN